MLQSIQYKNVYAIASAVRKKYGYANIETAKNLQNSAWIMQNLQQLSFPDIALLAEYNRDPNVRAKIMERLDLIKPHLGYIPELNDVKKITV